MRTYIFLNNSIRQMGGAQMYIRNKMLDLESRGWHVEVFFYAEGEILIPELKRFENNRISDLGNPIFALSKRRKIQVIDKIADIVKTGGEVLIESSAFHFRHWGELIAKRLLGINLLFFVNEGYPHLSMAEEDYLLWKQNRGEYLNCKKMKEKASLRVAKAHDTRQEFGLTPYNNITSSENYNFEYDESLPVITSVGRLDKDYILPMVREIIKFVVQNDMKVNLFFIGGASEEYYLENIKNELIMTNKVIPHFFGYLFPIATNILKATDVMIAAAGSVLLGASQGIPTISIDVNDCQALGVFGHTTENRFFRTSEPIIPTSVWLKNILIEGKHKNSINYVESKMDSINNYNAIIMDEILKNNREYYDVDAIYSFKDKISYYLHLIFRNMIGLHCIRRCKTLFGKSRFTNIGIQS